MYFLVKGKCVGEYQGTFEWVITADSKEDAIIDAKKDLTKQDIITEVEELSVEQCIEREMEDIKSEIKRQYLISHYDYENISIRRYNEIKQEFDSSLDNFYQAIKEANMKLRLMRRIERFINVDQVKLKDIRKFLTEAVKAETEEQLTEILNKLKEVK